MDQRVATALLSYVTQGAFDAALALRDGRLDRHDADIFGGATNLVNAPAWPGNITWDLLAGTNQIRNLHATGPLSIALANEILAALAAYSTTAQVGTAISDALGAYSSTSEMNTAIADAVDALNVGQYQDAAEVQFLIDQALLAYWDQSEVSSFVAGELANYATSASVSSSISSALSSYDDSSQVDSKIITALLDFYTRAEVDQAIADATSGSVDLSNYYTSSETQSYVANELLAYYPRTELDSLLTATLTKYWTSGRTQTEIDDARAFRPRRTRTYATSCGLPGRRAGRFATGFKNSSRPGPSASCCGRRPCRGRHSGQSKYPATPL